jgi:hypothetical protein
MRIPTLKIKNKKILLDSKNEIERIREHSDILAICATPTGYSWLGVKLATISLFGDYTFQIPQHYSYSILNDKELNELSNHIIKLQFKQIIFSGFAPFYIHIINNISKHTKIKVVYHGFLAELSENKLQQTAFYELIKLAKEKKIHSIGFVKKGLALSVNKMFNISTFEIILPNNRIVDFPQANSKEINIGCLLNTTFRKNIHNQAIAGLMIQNSKIHVFKTDELTYLSQDRIIYHSLMNHDDFLSLLGEMSVNLHVTFSESWGQVCAESISQGVPCITSHTSSFFDYDENLKKELIVEGFDDSWYIYKKIEAVLANRERLSKMCIDYAKRLNVLALEKKQLFLND